MYERFLELLQRSNKTTHQVSQETGIADSTFSDWKKGRYKPKLDKLIILADYFGVSVCFFWEDDKNKTNINVFN